MKIEDLHKYILSGANRIWRFWPPRELALRKAAKGALRVCAHCKDSFWPKEVQVDHIQPVINPLTGFVSYDEYYKRRFVLDDSLQILCKACHSKKSIKENAVRRKVKKQRKL